MSFFELRACLAGNAQHVESQRVMGAWMCANVMSCWSKEPVQPAQLLGRDEGPRETTDPDEFKARMQAKLARQRMENV